MSILDPTSPSTRYIPQSPKPHSPPETPSPSSSPAKSNEIQSPHIHSFDAVMNSITQSQPQPQALRITPDHTPELRPLSGEIINLTEESPMQPLYPEQGQGQGENEMRTELPRPSGMGIYFPSTINPLPVELTRIRSDDETAKPNQKQSGPPPLLRTLSDPNRSPNGSTSPLYGLYPNPQPFVPPRPRSTSPRPPQFLPSPAEAFASSSSTIYSAGNGEFQPHQRVVSPTRHDFDFPQNLVTNISSSSSSHQQASPISPAMDGKKEPHIKPPPVPHYGQDGYDPSPARRNGYGPNYGSYGYQQYPLSGTYKESISEKSHPDGVVKERFTDSVGYWLGLYFFFNLGLTLFNKVVLVSFPFPYVRFLTFLSTPCPS